MNEELDSTKMTSKLRPLISGRTEEYSKSRKEKIAALWNCYETSEPSAFTSENARKN